MAIKTTASIVFLAGLGAGCAGRAVAPARQPNPPTASDGGFGSAAYRAQIQACYSAALPQHPGLSVHTTASYFARDGKVVFADVDLPEAPELARCLKDAIQSEGAIPMPAVPQVPGSVAGGAVRVDLGPPLATPTPSPKLAEVRARHQRLVLEALRQGALRESDPIVRETRNPPPPWPTAEMRAELDACYREALKSHPGLVLHRHVSYLNRGGKVLLADVSIPEAPELARCVVDRVATWASPFSPTSETLPSSFFLDLGGPEEFPDPPGDLRTDLARRDALVARALQLRLINANDPILERLKPGSISTPSPRATPSQ